MSPASATALIVANVSSFGVAALAVLAAIIAVAVGLLVFHWGCKLLWNLDGTTNWLGRHWSWYDQHTYKPYKGYNRMHSRKWNMEHTM